VTEIRLLPSHDETSSVRVLVIDDRSILALDAMVDADFFCEERGVGEEARSREKEEMREE
jgi:hypothetical protein